MKSSLLLLLASVFLSFWAATADAAATLRSSPFSPIDVSGTDGFAHCAVTNASGNPGAVSAILYGSDGTALMTIANVNVAAHSTAVTDYVDYHPGSPTHCECVVPSANGYRCSFVFEVISPSTGFIVIPATP